MTDEQAMAECRAQIRAQVDTLLALGMYSSKVRDEVTKCLEESIKTYYDSLGTRHE